MIKLKSIPKDLQDHLINEFKQFKSKYNLRDWGPGELKAGRFAEAMLRIFQFLVGESITPFGSEITSQEKDKLINKVVNSNTINAHIRQKVTVLVRLLLDFRNNRDAAHIGGFDANHMDANFTLCCSKWILCEIIRVFGDYSMEQAESIVSEINIKEFPAVIEIDGEQFVAKPGLTAEQEILVLLYKNSNGSCYNFLFIKTKDGNQTRFKKRLKSLQNKKLIAKNQDKYFLMPYGIKIVEETNLLQ